MACNLLQISQVFLGVGCTARAERRQGTLFSPEFLKLVITGEGRLPP
jgi:hypothetical protein